MNAGDGWPWLGREQARRIDALAIARGTSGLELMERAGAACAEWIGTRIRPRSAWIVCGVGNNGGDGLVIARRLRGIAVRLWLVGDRDKLSPDARVNLDRWLETGGAVEAWPPIPSPVPPDVAIDCLLGTGSRGDPRGRVSEAIVWLNQLACPRVAIDLPSGLDCDSGCPGKPTVRADWTLTMVGPKRGFQAEGAGDFVGQWEVIDLGLPAGLVTEACAGPAG